MEATQTEVSELSEQKKRGRPRKVAAALATEEVLKNLFPEKVVQAAKEEVRKAEKFSKQATEGDFKA
jgi:hypothetical protein